MSKNFISARKAAESKGITRQMFYYYVKDGRAPAPIIDDPAYLWDEEEITRWDIVNKQRGPKPKQAAE